MGFSNRPLVAMLVLSVAVTLASSMAMGDILYLKNGKKAEGTVVSRDDTKVIFQSNGGTLRVPMSQIDRLDTAQAAAAEQPGILDDAQRLEKGGRAAEAYAAYESLKNNISLSTTTRQQAADRMAAVLDDAVAKTKERYSADLDSGNITVRLDQMEHEKADRRLSRFEDLVLRVVEGDLRIRLASQEIDKGNATGALSELEKVENLGISCPGFNVAMGSVLLEMGLPARATPYLAKAVEEDSDDCFAASQQIIALSKAGRYEEAVSCWEKRPAAFDASEFRNDAAEAAGKALRTQGLANLKENRTIAASNLYTKGLDLSPPRLDVYQEAEKFYTQLGDAETAAKMNKMCSALESRLTMSGPTARAGAAVSASTAAGGGGAKKAMTRMQSASRPGGAGAGGRSTSQASGGGGGSGRKIIKKPGGG